MKVNKVNTDGPLSPIEISSEYVQNITLYKQNWDSGPHKNMVLEGADSLQTVDGFVSIIKTQHYCVCE